MLSQKSNLVAFLLCFFLGVLSAHRFYVGRYGSAILQILTLGGLGLWVMIDFFTIIFGNFEDKEGKVLMWKKEKAKA